MELLIEHEQILPTAPREIFEGESAGDYKRKWTSTFDLVFLIIMILILISNCVITSLIIPQLWKEWKFWLKQMIIFSIMSVALFIGGLICGHFCNIDKNGYIVTNKSSRFKVNYTRKLQHFVAHLLPVTFSGVLQTQIIIPETLNLAWSYWFVLLVFLLLIKPIRERIRFMMLQFHSLDRPEDRPHTLFWIVVGNKLPGVLLTVFFRWLYPFTGQQRDLAYIFIFITSIGDGLAEPVGIYFGKHRYKTRGLCNNTLYERSYEGSACVFISSIVFTSTFWYAFTLPTQFWIAIIILPILMSFAEALSPHSCDTPFLHSVGGLTLFIISHINIQWI
ncbi:unnamed protein product [Didymodactylos carnosus]|uniref:Dolichol kinase n=1 Tax=Didymodactylos carnosus TaxID=1234261 RepID=A0A814J519_9BILA|nr:unnamed protein product [Didymodactylos carnosus]CAF1042882.1 unnamed protein product [Didymodactylos carnosus]CAF3802066.1 unnamed protein product [Didymodactylos carnosus]CAF3810989.1 unnamed protein product [Didymodactylos carnosus]